MDLSEVIMRNPLSLMSIRTLNSTSELEYAILPETARELIYADTKELLKT